MSCKLRLKKMILSEQKYLDTIPGLGEPISTDVGFDGGIPTST